MGGIHKCTPEHFFSIPKINMYKISSGVLNSFLLNNNTGLWTKPVKTEFEY